MVVTTSVDRTVVTSLRAASGPNCDTEYHHGMAMPAAIRTRRGNRPSAAHTGVSWRSKARRAPRTTRINSAVLKNSPTEWDGRKVMKPATAAPNNVPPLTAWPSHAGGVAAAEGGGTALTAQ